MLALIGVTPEGKKALISFQNGACESAQLLARELVIELKRPGLEIEAHIFVAFETYRLHRTLRGRLKAAGARPHTSQDGARRTRHRSNALPAIPNNRRPSADFELPYRVEQQTGNPALLPWSSTTSPPTCRMSHYGHIIFNWL
jgi:hypothetical protein